MKARLLATIPFITVAIAVLALIDPRLPAPACHQDRGPWLCEIPPAKVDTYTPSLPIGRQAVLEKDKLERGPDNQPSGLPEPQIVHPTVGVGHSSRVVLANNRFGRHLNESQRGMVATRLATMRQGGRSDRSEPSATLRKADQLAAAGGLQGSARSVQSGMTVRQHRKLKLIQTAEQDRIEVEPAAHAAQAVRLPADQQDKFADMAEAGNAGKPDLRPPPYDDPLPSYTNERERLDPWHGYDSRDGPENGY
jgi:hypothetical protein